MVKLLAEGKVSLYPIYLSVALIRSANAVFMVSLAVTFPELRTGVYGFILATYSVVEAFSGFIAGILYEILGLRLSLAIASSMLVAVYILMSSSQSIWELAVLNAIAGFSASLILVSSLSAVAEGTRGAAEGRRIFGVGGFEASNLGGYAFGFLLAGSLEILGILRGFTIPAILSSASLISGLLVRGIVVRRGLSYRDFYSVSRRSLILIPMWFGFALILGVGFLSPNIIKELNLGIPLPHLRSAGKEGGLVVGYGASSSIGLLLILVLIGIAGGIMLGSLVAAKIGKERALLLGTFSLPAALIVLGLTYEKLLLFLPLIIILATPALAIPPTLLTFLANYTDNTRRGPSAGVYVTTLGVGIVTGEILGGRIFDSLGLGPLAYLLAIIFLALSLPTSVYVARHASEGEALADR